MALLQTLAHAPAHQFWIMVAALSASALAAFFAGLRYVRRGRLYEDTPTARIRSAAQGYVELQGVVSMMPGPPITAALTGRRCCWWRTKVEYRDDSNRNEWSELNHEISNGLFRLTDASGHCVVDPGGARVIPSIRQVWYGPTPRPPWGPVMGQGVLRAATSKYRYTEERIDLDKPLYAVGMFKTHRGAEALENPVDQVRDLLVKWKKDPRMMALFDTNGDGMIDATEWEAVRKMAREKVRTRNLQEMPGEDVPVLCCPPDSRPYVLSAMSQDELIGREHRRAKIYLLLCVIATALAGALLVTRHVI